MRKIWCALVGASLALGACSTTPEPDEATDTTPPESAAEAETSEIAPTAKPPEVDTTGLETVATESGLKYIDLKVGEGEMPETGALVEVHYHGVLEDGSTFDSSYERGEPLVFPVGVGQVIPGWDEGVGSMKVGGQRKLTIPPELAYGSQEVGPIPPDSTLIFSVELLRILE